FVPATYHCAGATRARISVMDHTVDEIRRPPIGRDGQLGWEMARALLHRRTQSDACGGLSRCLGDGKSGPQSKGTFPPRPNRAFCASRRLVKGSIVARLPRAHGDWRIAPGL